VVNGVSTFVSTERPKTDAPAAREAADDAQKGTNNRAGEFVTGPENRLLSAVLKNFRQAISEGATSPRWQALTTPLVLVGATGSGKTHLVSELAEAVGPKLSCLTTANDLRRDFAAAIEQGDAIKWRERLAKVPLLLIDGVDTLPTRGIFFQELLHLTAQHEARGHKLVVTSSQPIAHLNGWLPDLVNWFAGGLTLEIAPLGAGSRSELLTMLAARHAWRFSDEAFAELARQASPEPRELFRLADDMLRQFGRGAQLEADTLLHFLEKRKAAQAPQLREIIRVVARYHSVPLKMLTSSSRQAGVVAARATAIYLARSLTDSSYERIGSLLGGRDHTTIMHSHRRTTERLVHEPALRLAVEELTRLLRK